MTLGDLGANVIKVESLEGDEARKWGPPFIEGSKDSFYYLAVNRNKKSICINLKSPEGNYDVIAAAMGGLLNATGERNGNPCKPGIAITDLTTGLHGFGAVMAALYYRQKTGKGQKIDCNLLSTQISSMINLASIYLNCGIECERWGTAHANLVPYQAFNTKDGDLVIGTGSNAQFADFCKLIGKEELSNDDRFKDNSDRVKNRDECIRIISEVIKTKTSKEWTEIFKTASFPNGPVNKMSDVFADEHVKAIELVKELPHPDCGTVKLVGPPTVYSEGGNYARTAPPTLGQHTKDDGPTPEPTTTVTLRPDESPPAPAPPDKDKPSTSE
ncbi:hypothetical protein MSG28_001945 [Choristoneura fumiferana]|uniref:Uncharacterized protein n=1 Tax=Choristoneura fumiferana TaxID=7141 RepID=A0ACC0JT77_CHOFU|nr:hypothetical protein MSG28_001945 [Choristoneura fumiferana]